MAEFDDAEDFKRRLFGSGDVKELKDEDFMLNTVERIVLLRSGCSAVLFYIIDDDISLGLREIWYDLSASFAGINFLAVNASERTNIMQGFAAVAGDPDHPLSRYIIRGYPTVLIYREGGQGGLSWPKAFYHGVWSRNSLQDWLLTLACEPGYEETPSLREGVVSDRDIVVTDPRGIVAPEGRPVSSLDYSTGDFEALEEDLIDDRIDLDNSFADEAINAGLTNPQVLQDLEDERLLSDQYIRSFRSTDPLDSPVDPGYFDGLSDRDLGFVEG